MRKSDTSGLETVTRVGRDRLSTKPADSSTLIRLRKILWATDFSPFSEAALLYALAIARRYGAQIYLAHVIWEDAFQMVVPEAVASMLKEAERHVENQMARLLVSGRFRGISHQVLILRGEIWPALSAMIEKHEIDMLIIGTHGRTDMRKLLLGSVAEQIFRLASCPVLTVGPRASGKVPEETELRQILYATDFAPTSGFAAAYALSLAQEHQAHLTLLHVMQEGAHPSPEMAARMKESLTGQLRGLVPPRGGLVVRARSDAGIRTAGGRHFEGRSGPPRRLDRPWRPPAGKSLRPLAARHSVQGGVPGGMPRADCPGMRS